MAKVLTRLGERFERPVVLLVLETKLMTELELLNHLVENHPHFNN
jgi:hypothetical protein